jgi:hypothetical protein
MNHILFPTEITQQKPWFMFVMVAFKTVIDYIQYVYLIFRPPVLLLYDHCRYRNYGL